MMEDQISFSFRCDTMRISEVNDVVSVSFGAGLLALSILGNNINDTSQLFMKIGLILVILSGFLYLVAYQLGILSDNNYGKLLTYFNLLGAGVVILSLLFSDFSSNLNSDLEWIGNLTNLMIFMYVISLILLLNAVYSLLKK